MHNVHQLAPRIISEGAAAETQAQNHGVGDIRLLRRSGDGRPSAHSDADPRVVFSAHNDDYLGKSVITGLPLTTEEDDIEVITEVELCEDFAPIESNRHDDGFSIDGRNYLFKQEDPLMRKVHDNRIWSLLEDADGEAIICSGRHYNALGYLITMRPHQKETMVSVWQ